MLLLLISKQGEGARRTLLLFERRHLSPPGDGKPKLQDLVENSVTFTESQHFSFLSVTAK